MSLASYQLLHPAAMTGVQGPGYVIEREILTHLGNRVKPPKSGRPDLNRRPLDPQSSALSRLRHVPRSTGRLRWASYCCSTRNNCNRDAGSAAKGNPIVARWPPPQPGGTRAGAALLIPARSPVQARPQCRKDFLVFGKPAGGMLGEDDVTVHFHVEYAAAPLDQHRIDAQFTSNCVRQTDGFGTVVSLYAVGDRNTHRRILSSMGAAPPATGVP